MSDSEKITKWIVNNKQIGSAFSFNREGELFWSSVAIQKWDDTIKVYVDEILESKMHAEEYLREETLEFQNVTDAIEYICEHTMVDLDQLKPCKGQKIFNPKF